mgnify:FL=1
MIETKYVLSHYKGALNVEYPKNIRTNLTESYCLNLQGDLLWCYFSSELGIFLKNMETKITERILTIQEIKFLEIDYNLITDSYILFYNYKNRLYIKYLEGEVYVTKEILSIKTLSKVFMTYHKLSGRITLIFKDRTNNLISEVSSEDNFESVQVLKEDPITKEEIVTVSHNEIDNLVYVDLVVSDNSIMKDLIIHPLLKDKTFRYIPIDVSHFKV